MSFSELLGADPQEEVESLTLDDVVKQKRLCSIGVPQDHGCRRIFRDGETGDVV